MADFLTKNNLSNPHQKDKLAKIIKFFFKVFMIVGAAWIVYEAVFFLENGFILMVLNTSPDFFSNSDYSSTSLSFVPLFYVMTVMGAITATIAIISSFWESLWNI